jgi:hypothetical protein
MRRRLPYLGLLLLAWLAATGEVGVCPLFQPATPEQGGGGVIIPTNYLDPDSTLATLARGMNAKANGRDAYMGGIADTTRDGRSFRANFDPSVVARYNAQPGAVGGWDPWGTDLERQWFFNFVQYKSGAYTMTWGPDTFHPADDRGVDVALLHRSYKITSLQSDGSNLIIAVGYADLFFLRNASGRWVILRWDDRADDAYGGANPPNAEQVPLGWRRLTQRG